MFAVRSGIMFCFLASSGPPRLPLLGSLLSMPGTLTHLHAEKHWRRRHGPLVGLVTASQPILMVCGPDEVLALLSHEHCQARPTTFPFTERSFGKRLGEFSSTFKYHAITEMWEKGPGGGTH